MVIWRRIKIKIGRLFGSAPLEIRSTHESTCRLPYEIVEMIIARLAFDFNTLKACSFVCRSWYIAAAPHLYHTLTFHFGDEILGQICDELKPQSMLYDLGLVPLVKEVRVLQSPGTYVPDDLLYFSAFTNVDTLRIQGLDIDRFMPGIEHHFGQLSPTLRSISLYNLSCSAPRKLSHFLSLFPNLDDIDIRWPSQCDPSTLDPRVVPFSAPKLRGKLALYGFPLPDTWASLISICGGLRFRHMELRAVGVCARMLLEACAQTLETLRFYVPDNPSPPSTYLRPDLSQLRVLKSLEVGDWEYEPWTTGCPQSHVPHDVVKGVFSTITSPVFSEFVVVVLAERFSRLLFDGTVFDTLRAMHEVRPFELVFLILHVSGSSLPQEVRGVYEREVESSTARGLLNFLTSPPTVRIAAPSPFPYKLRDSD